MAAHAPAPPPPADAADATDGAPPATAPLAEEVVRLSRTMAALRGQLAARRPDGVEAAAYQLLGHLVREGAQRQSVLAEAAGVDPSTASRQVAQLVERGLVERRPDPSDGRACQLAATGEGLATAERLRAARAVAFALLVEGWEPGDVARLAELLGRLNDGLAARRTEVLDALAPQPREGA